MTALARPEAGLGPESIQAVVGYLEATSPSPEIYLCKPPDGVAAENCATDLRRVAMHNVRAADAMPTLSGDGVQFVRDELPSIDFDDAQQVRATYYPMLQRLALKVTGGTDAFVFDHLVRRRDPQVNLFRFGERGPKAKVGALGRVHNDYSELSGRRRLKLVMDEFGTKVQPRHYCIVNLWRSIGGVIEDSPLAFCAAPSVFKDDLVSATLHYGHRDGEIYLLKFNPGHRWLYMDGMDNMDVAVFKQFDTRLNAGSRFVPHSAFDLPGAEAAKSHRSSIEARVLVYLQ